MNDRMHRHALALIVSAALASALAACGGSSSQPESTQPPDPNVGNVGGPSEPPKTDPEPPNTIPDTPPPPT